MRLRIVLLSMALGVVLAGNARADDSTADIYDLTTLRSQAKPDDKGPPDHDDLGDKTPHDRRDWGHERGRGRGRDRHGDVDLGEERQSEPSPTPEPGTMLLLGGALVAGMRRFRKR
jgi:hypothetical protein